jgi:hypothetical protein
VNGNAMFNDAAQEEIMLREIVEKLDRMPAPSKAARQFYNLTLRTSQS